LKAITFVNYTFMLECMILNIKHGTRMRSKFKYSSVGTALDYGLDDLCSRVRFPVEAGNFSVHHRVQNDSGAHPASYAMATRGSFPGDKAVGA
jgi:hypothetical protein